MSDNWVDRAGGLPPYLKRVADAIKRRNPEWTEGHCIAAALESLRRWVADPRTHPDTKAKAVAALAQWEAMKAKARLT